MPSRSLIGEVHIPSQACLHAAVLEPHLELVELEPFRQSARDTQSYQITWQHRSRGHRLLISILRVLDEVQRSVDLRMRWRDRPCVVHL